MTTSLLVKVDTRYYFSGITISFLFWFDFGILDDWHEELPTASEEFIFLVDEQLEDH